MGFETKQIAPTPTAGYYACIDRYHDSNLLENI